MKFGKAEARGFRAHAHDPARIVRLDHEQEQEQEHQMTPNAFTAFVQ